MDRVYVIGHVNPDTDSIASAMGYAWLLRERDGGDVVAARAGALNPQTAWVLKFLELEPPLLLNDASPRFESVCTRLDTTLPDSPLHEAWSIANRTWGVAPVINEDGTPYGLVNGPSLFAFLAQVVGPNPRRHEMKIADILEMPCHEACMTDVPFFQGTGKIRDSLNRILREESDDFLVVDENNHYLGVCRQRDVLNPPRLKLVLVDHNEPRQALGALEEAELIEILDHHRLGQLSTHTPIRFSVDVVGSTSTLVSERIEDAGMSPPPKLAGVLLAGLVADTLILNSPTTTPRDQKAAERLSRWAFGRAHQRTERDGPLAGSTLQSFGEQVLRAGSGLDRSPADEIVSTDLKVYDSAGLRFAIAQVEVSNFLQLGDYLSELSQALSALRERRGLDFAMLMVTDVVRGSSRLVLANEPPVLGGLPYPLQPDGTRLAEGVVSRKKQLLPVVLGLLEG
jgi:manganese-dependent inorganic pyrophosphatase